MTTLILKDLSVTAELDAKELAAVRGGSRGLYGDMGNFGPSYSGPSLSFSKSDLNFNAAQSLGQCQNTEVNNGNNAAFVCGITSNVTPSQCGQNTINFSH
jgi:hypothetical protein